MMAISCVGQSPLPPHPEPTAPPLPCSYATNHTPPQRSKHQLCCTETCGPFSQHSEDNWQPLIPLSSYLKAKFPHHGLLMHLTKMLKCLRTDSVTHLLMLDGQWLLGLNIDITEHRHESGSLVSLDGLWWNENWEKMLWFWKWNSLGEACGSAH